MYGKLVDGEFILAPKEFVEEITTTHTETYVDEETGEEKSVTYEDIEEITVVGFTEEYLKSKGYKPLQITDNTTENAISIIRTYTEDDDYIYCTISDSNE